jgi:hypothetical protein
VWRLEIDKYYCGRLRPINGKCFFDAPDKVKDFEKLAEFFGDYSTAWF